MKRLEDLSDLQKEIIQSLRPSRSAAMSIKEIQDFLQAENQKAALPDIYKEIGELIKYGAIRGEAGKGGRKYFLSRGIGSGYRNQATLFGRGNPIRDVYKMVQRILGSVFLLVGLGIFAYQNTSTSGAVVAEVAGNQTVPLVSSLLLIVAGGFLLFQSVKKIKKD